LHVLQGFAADAMSTEALAVTAIATNDRHSFES
jgi:hypothetical protein